jgi:hypothetical protein
MRRLPSYNRRAFLRFGAGLAAGTSMAVSAERNKALAGESPISLLAGGENSEPAGPQSRKALRPFGPFRFRGNFNGF